MQSAHSAAKAAECIDRKRIESGLGFAELRFEPQKMRIATDCYTSREYAERERERVWMRVWQVAGRVDELPQAGDWKEYRIFDQSFLIVHGSDGKLRGFVNACRHRGNVLCQGKNGHSEGRITCPYHKWSYALDGRLVGVGRPDLVGPLDKSEHGLLQVPVDSFGGFIFLNPDPQAQPLAEFLGKDIMSYLAPYHLDEMVPVMDVREPLECNWKVVMDAFQEGYHIDGIHPELLSVIVLDITKTRYNFIGDHNLAVAPFEVKNVEGFGPEQEIEGIRKLPETFPGVVQILPRFEELVASYRDANGVLKFPDGVSARTLLQRATRETLSGNGLDVSGLTDDQMSDNHGYLLFPNFFMTVRAGEAHVIMAVPHPDGDPNRCIWHVASYMWLPPGPRETYRAQPVEVEEPGSFNYFLALQQDYEQMPRQQKGLRNSALKYMTLAQEEVCIANFHAVLDRYMARTAERAGAASAG
jgi:phenylpropionate dioxygenase-like ring-hydroxylating dioxygenase large terminal subunit